MVRDVVFYWQRPLGAKSDVRRLKISGRLAGSSWALPLTLLDIHKTLETATCTTLEMVHSQLLEETVWKDICRRLREIQTLQEVHFLEGCSDTHNAMLVQSLQQTLTCVHLYSSTTNQTLCQLQNCNKLRILKLQRAPNQPDALLRIVPRLNRFVVHSARLTEYWQLLVQTAEQHSVSMSFLCGQRWKPYIETLAAINALQQEHSPGLDEAFVVWKDWFRSTHRPPPIQVVEGRATVTNSGPSRRVPSSDCGRP